MSRKSDDSRNIDVEVNSIRSLYPKESKSSILDWVNNGLLKWVNKEKAIKFFSTQEPNYLAGGKENDSLSSATKLINDFENPKLHNNKIDEQYLENSNLETDTSNSEQVIIDTVTQTATSLSSPVVIITNTEDITKETPTRNFCEQGFES
ncbi:MAG: hypothetical protein R3Y50_06205 [Rikenellaceae bacterium]